MPLNFSSSSGDYREDIFVKKADVYHQKDVLSKEMDGPSEEKPVSAKFTHEEVVQFVTVTPLGSVKEGFSIAIKMTCRMQSAGSKTVYSEWVGVAGRGVASDAL